MSAYENIEQSMQAGVVLNTICSLCSWTTYCISPPSMTKAQVEAQLEKAKEQDTEMMEKAKADGKDGGLPVATLVAALTMGDRDKMARICPVFAARLIETRALSDELKRLMQEWTD